MNTPTPLFALILDHGERLGVTWSRVCQQAGVSYHSFRHAKRGTRSLPPAAERALAAHFRIPDEAVAYLTNVGA